MGKKFDASAYIDEKWPGFVNALTSQGYFLSKATVQWSEFKQVEVNSITREGSPAVVNCRFFEKFSKSMFIQNPQLINLGKKGALAIWAAGTMGGYGQADGQGIAEQSKIYQLALQYIPPAQ